MAHFDIHATKLVIIGNGFDLNLGLKTSYKDYLNSSYFKELIFQKNPFAEALAGRFDLDRWIDVEIELKDIAKNYTTTSRIHFEKLCNNLMEYLSNMVLPDDCSNSMAFSLLQRECQEECVILDFNYTNNVKELMKRIPGILVYSYDFIIKMHGSIENKSIIFGVEDEALIDRKHIYLKKSYHKNYKGSDLFANGKSIKELHIFGHSLGETDHPYFGPYLMSLANGNISESTKLYLYHYGADAYEDLIRQLDIMTSGQLRNLKQNLEIIPIDVK